MIACVGKVGSNIVGAIVGGRLNMVVGSGEDLFLYVEGGSDGMSKFVKGRRRLIVKKLTTTSTTQQQHERSER